MCVRQYAAQFKRNLVDGLVLLSLTDKDLESELGIQLPVPPSPPSNAALVLALSLGLQSHTRTCCMEEGLGSTVRRSYTGASCFSPVTESRKAAECISPTHARAQSSARATLSHAPFHYCT